jgi:hypothetical protein
MRMRALVVGLLVALCLPAASTAAKAPPTSPKQMKAIVHAWSNKLNAGDNEGLAHLFRLPAIVIQNYGWKFNTYAQLAQWHSLLPCAGHIKSIQVRGRFATAVFRLADRKGSPCDAPGAVVAARFEIVGGKIVSWQQVAVPEPAEPNAI